MGATQYERARSNGPEVPDEPIADVASLSEDDVFEALSNERRRYAIRYLNEVDAGPVRVRDLSQRIAAWENGVPAGEVTYKERKRVYTSLYQLHLEKMDRLGIVSYDRDRGAVAATPVTGALQRYLETESDDDGGEAEPNWWPFWLSVCCAIVVAVAWLGALPFASGAGYAVAFAVASVFVIVTSAQVVRER